LLAWLTTNPDPTSLVLILIPLDPTLLMHKTHRTDPFLKKEWYDIKAPGYFKTRKVGKTLITRTTGTSTYTIVD
jgi:hypothetical protein